MQAVPKEAPPPEESLLSNAGARVERDNFELNAPNIRGKFCENNGGIENLEGMRTLIQKGIFFQEAYGENPEGEFKFVQYKRRPRKSFLRLETDDLWMGFYLNQEHVWQVAKPVGRPEMRVEMLLEGRDAQIFRETGSFYTPFTEYCLGEKGAISDLSEGSADGVSYIEFTFDPLNNTPIRQMRIHREHFYVMEELMQLAEGDTRRTVNSDYRQVSRIWVPFKVMVYDNEQLINRITVEETVFNSGILAALFEPPEKIREEILAAGGELE